MITREQINELAQFEDQASCALSFYFQPSTPRNKAHKEDAILAKDLAREALRQIETNGKNESARADLDRIVRLSQELRGNGAHAKVVFACGAHKFWREYDLPAQLSGTQLVVDRHFHLKPLAQLLGAFPNLGILLVDRHRARLFDLRLGELTEREGFFHPLTRRGRGDGFAGYDGGHAQRRVEDEALHHYKFVADFVKDALDKGMFEKWILGCQETHWPQIETQLHSYASQKLLGRFSAEVARASLDGIRSQAERIFAESQERRCSEILHETISQARANGRGVTGLRRVLNSMEAGEVQTLFVGQNYHSQAVECAGCGHLDAHLVSFCPVCGRETRQVVDVSDAILPWVIRRNIELFYVKDDAEFDKVGNIAALLRFRSEQNKNVRSISEAPLNPSYSRKEGMVGRYRGLASG
jgi:peptide subunit release factor 1 (eRF1)